MRLTHQLTLFIVTLLIFVLMGTLYISIKSSREYLVQQLQTQTQETTISLALKLSPILLKKDKVLARVMAHAIFDNGHYQQVTITNMLGESIVERKIPIVVEGVPQWFVELIPIKPPVGETIIQEKWKQLATLRLVAHTGYAYSELWQVAVSSLSLLLLLGVISFFILWGIIKIIMRPLSEVEKQANEISQQNFSFRPALPKTPELRKFVLVMNNMAEKVERFISEQTKRVNDLRTKIYTDKTTNLMNRAGLEVHLNDLLKNRSEEVEGDLLLLHVQGLELVNEKEGYKQGNNLLKQMVSQLQIINDNDWELARLNGKDFIILLKGYDMGGLSALCERVQKFVSEKIPSLQFYVAGTTYQSGQKWIELLSLADIALSQALKSPQCWHALSSNQEKALPLLTATQWREKLLSNMDNESIMLHSQTCFAANKIELHKEILLRSEHQGEALPISTIISIAHRCHLTEQLDRYVIQKVFKIMETTSTTYSVNIMPASLMKRSFLEWIEKSLKERNINKERLILEISEHGLQHQREIMISVLRDMSSKKLSFAFDGVGANNVIFSELGGILPRYIKMDGRYSIDIESNPEHQSIVENILLLAKTISAPVIAMHVESQQSQDILFKLGVDGVQGYFPAKPENLNS